MFPGCLRVRVSQCDSVHGIQQRRRSLPFPPMVTYPTASSTPSKHKQGLSLWFIPKWWRGGNKLVGSTTCHADQWYGWAQLDLVTFKIVSSLRQYRGQQA